MVRITPTPTRAVRGNKPGHWKGPLEGVTDAQNGYAFVGPFLPGYRPVDLPEGSVIVRKNWSKDGWLWYVGKVDAEAQGGVQWGDPWPIANFLAFRDHVAGVMSGETWAGYDGAYAAEAEFVDLKDALRRFFETHRIDFPALLEMKVPAGPEAGQPGAVDALGYFAQYLTDHFKSRNVLSHSEPLPADSPERPVIRPVAELAEAA